ncbi:MAG: tRNA uracil 4-sulfurtransferase ThiI [Patescibacteria group bacterium]
MKWYILVHYGEIGLKLSNMNYFVDKILKVIREKLQGKFRKTFKVTHTLKRILVDLPEDFDVGRDSAEYVEVLNKVFGVKNFNFVLEGVTELEELGKQIQANLPAIERAESFKVDVKRSMILPYKSPEAERYLGGVLLSNGLNLKVKLKNPDFAVWVEMFNNKSYFGFKRYAGLGGMPTGSQSKLVSLLSAGFDSPVASYMLMKRGARVIFVHFSGYPFGDKQSVDNVESLVKILSEYQDFSKLYIVPFGQIQKDIAMNFEVPEKQRTVIYKRLMLRIAQKITFDEKADGMITGDSYGQVASQTPENLLAIHEATILPLFQPLIGFDKEEIIALAEKIGTDKISSMPCVDTCSMFGAIHPEIRANLLDLKKYEENLPMDKWINESVKNSEIKML